MNNLLIIILISTCTQVFGNIKTEKEINKICQLALNCEVYKTESKSIKQMVLEYALFVEGSPVLDEDYVSQLIYVPTEDETKWGLFGKRSAANFVLGHISSELNFNEKPELPKTRAVEIIDYISNSSDPKIKFGFSSNTGGSVCGISMPGLLIIDQANQTVYDLSLFGWPSC